MQRPPSHRQRPRQFITAYRRRPFGQIASTVKSHRRVEKGISDSEIGIPANAPAMPAGRGQRAARGLPRPRHRRRQHVHRTFHRRRQHVHRTFHQHRRHPPLAQLHTTASHTLAGPQSTLDAGMVSHGYGPRSHRAVRVVDAAAPAIGLHAPKERTKLRAQHHRHLMYRNASLQRLTAPASGQQAGRLI